MIIIVGLGNPGAEYDWTPHNVGFAVVEELANRLGVRFRRSASGLAQEAVVGGVGRAVLLKPQTFMNRSGSAVQRALDFYKCRPAELLVICDDVNLAETHLRFREGGGAGGQKGLVSIIQSISTQEFPRLRIGVGGGHPGSDVGSHVLRKRTGDSRMLFSETISNAADAVTCYLEYGMAVAGNKFNTKKDNSAGTLGNPQDSP